MSATILVIEAQEQNRSLVTDLLERRGHHVIIARNGPEGIALARDMPPAVIVLDIQLPEMDGYAIARQLSDTPELQRIPIVAVTSYAMPGDREKTLAAGFTGYLEKPINPDTFPMGIEHFLPADGKCPR